MLLLRIVLLALFVYMYQWPLEKISTGQYHENEAMFWFGLMFFTLFPVYIIFTFFSVLWVTISNDRSTIRFHYFYKTVSVAGSEISGYYKTTHKTKVSTFDGLLIILKSNKTVVVTEYNVRSTKAIVGFLSNNSVPLRGDKDSWFLLKKRI